MVVFPSFFARGVKEENWLESEKEHRKEVMLSLVLFDKVLTFSPEKQYEFLLFVHEQQPRFITSEDLEEVDCARRAPA